MSAGRPRFIPPLDLRPPPGPGAEPVVWFQMPDGLEVGLRPIHPEDREALSEGFRALSDDSRYHRFLTPLPRLTDAQARYLTEIDQINHFAWGIGLRDPGGGLRGIGVARYVRESADAEAAEIAVAITDEHQGRGLGSLLVRALAVVAQTHGITRLTGVVLAENRAMIRIFEKLGGTTRSSGAGLVRADAVLGGQGLCNLGDAACTELVRVADRAAHPSNRHRGPDGA